MAKSEFGCGRPECGASTNINEDPSFGTGELDYYGFWEYGCYECARAFERLHPDCKCWPYERRDTVVDNLKRDSHTMVTVGMDKIVTVRNSWNNGFSTGDWDDDTKSK